MEVSKDTVLFAAPDDAEMQEAARAYVKGYGLGKDDVKMVLRGDILCVVAKRSVILAAKRD